MTGCRRSLGPWYGNGGGTAAGLDDVSLVSMPQAPAAAGWMKSTRASEDRL